MVEENPRAEIHPI